MDRAGKHQTKLLQQSGPLKVVGEKIIVVVAATIHHSNKAAAVKLYTKCSQLQIKFRFFCHSFHSAQLQRNVLQDTRHIHPQSKSIHCVLLFSLTADPVNSVLFRGMEYKVFSAPFCHLALTRFGTVGRFRGMSLFACSWCYHY